MTASTSRTASTDSFSIISSNTQTHSVGLSNPQNAAAGEQSSTMTSTPHLRRTKNSAQLIANGKPFLMLAGELHNSSLSSAAYMSELWPKMKHMNLNTLLGSVTWEMIEPTEGSFDFSELDKIIIDARKHDMHLVLLWFGSFKNALSTYVPGWVKKDVKRFPRVHIFDENAKLKTIELVSPFSEQAREADAKAFAALLRHLKEFDSAYSTVLMIQVENETGLLGDSRDRSKVANKAFDSPVPQELLKYLSEQKELHPTFEKRWPDFQTSLKSTKNSCWEDVFGAGIAAQELFMADAFARYVGYVAAAGKREYDIPLYTNCWLNFDNPSVLDLSGIPLGQGTPTVAGGGGKPGIYPSGGPVPHALDIWNHHTVDKGALDFIAPDLYLHDYEWVCNQYRYKNNPLFIPEQKADAAGMRRTWLAYGTYGCLGCSPFGVDTVYLDESELSGWRISNNLLSRMSRRILEVQATRPDDMFGFFFDEVDKKTSLPEQWSHTFKDIEMEVIVERSFVFGKPAPGYGIVLHQGDGKFLLMGSGFQTTFQSKKSNSTFTGILSSTEKEMDSAGNLTTLRTMNGDETRSGAFMIMPTEQPDYGGFPIRVTIPARTYLAEVEAYSLEEQSEDF